MSNIKCAFQNNNQQVAIDENNILWFRLKVSDSRYGSQWSTWNSIDLDPRHWQKIDSKRIRIRYDEKAKKNYGKTDEMLAEALELIIH